MITVGQSFQNQEIPARSFISIRRFRSCPAFFLLRCTFLYPPPGEASGNLVRFKASAEHEPLEVKKLFVELAFICVTAFLVADLGPANERYEWVDAIAAFLRARSRSYRPLTVNRISSMRSRRNVCGDSDLIGVSCESRYHCGGRMLTEQVKSGVISDSFKPSAVRATLMSLTLRATAAQRGQPLAPSFQAG